MAHEKRSSVKHWLKLAWFKDINLRVIDQYKKAFPDIIIGYSGHEIGFTPTLGAVALGAKVIERHFTLDTSMKGSDHQCSLDPTSFADMVKSIRTLEAALGKPEKTFLSCEKPCFAKLGKSLVAGRKMTRGETIGLADVKIKVILDSLTAISSTLLIYSSGCRTSWMACFRYN